MPISTVQINMIDDCILSTFSPSDSEGIYIHFLEGEWKSKQIEEGIVDSVYPKWEQRLNIGNLFNSEGLSASLKLSIISDFAQKIVKNTSDLDPSIVKIVDDNFWDLL